MGISTLRYGDMAIWSDMACFQKYPNCDMRKSKLRYGTNVGKSQNIQIAIWENPNCDMGLRVIKVKKSKLRYGTKVGKSKKNPNCNM